MNILIAVAFQDEHPYCRIRVTKAVEEDDDILLMVLKCLRGTQEVSIVLDGGRGITLKVFCRCIARRAR